MLKGIWWSLTFRLSLLLSLTVLAVYFALKQDWIPFGIVFLFWLYGIQLIRKLFRRNAEKVAFMFDAVDNSDHAFNYPIRGVFANDKLVNQSLNRMNQILYQAKADAFQKEKYYELIMDAVTTGIIVIDDEGYVFQTNKEALRLLGLSVFTHVSQLIRVDEKLKQFILGVKSGEKQQISFQNERGTIHLSVRVSEMTLQEKHVRILAINDINSELDDKEIDSWVRLTRVLTHEIMNSITPITSLSETLLNRHGTVNTDLRKGLETIRTTGNNLVSFVKSYRKFTHIPTPEPVLFYVLPFAERMVQLATHQTDYTHIAVTTHVEPDDLIVYADENLITQVVLNLLKNAFQAIGGERSDGWVQLKAYCNENDTIFIEIANNGPLIPTEEIEHIFVPFFTTKEGGTGVGLSVSRQIMRLSGGSLSLESNAHTGITTFKLTFP